MKKLLRAYGFVWLGGAAMHAYNCLQLGQQRGDLTLAWALQSAVLGVVCLWRGYRQAGVGTKGE